MLPIKEDEKFSKLVTKESSISNPSFRVYYGGNSVAVPFVWEAKPGTPKHTKHVDYSEEEDNKQYIPPLTPPPSYYHKQPKKLPTNNNNSSKRFSSRIFLGSLFPKSIHRRQVSSASSSSSSTLSCPSSSMLVPDSSTMRSAEESRSLSLSLSLSRGKRRTLSSPGSLFDFLVNGQEEDELEEMKSPRSVLCFGLGSRRIRSVSN